jgi:hypothetical protein
MLPFNHSVNLDLHWWVLHFYVGLIEISALKSDPLLFVNSASLHVSQMCGKANMSSAAHCRHWRQLFRCSCSQRIRFERRNLARRWERCVEHGNQRSFSKRSWCCSWESCPVMTLMHSCWTLPFHSCEGFSVFSYQNFHQTDIVPGG